MTNPVRINIEPGIQNGKILKLKGKGMPIYHTDKYGDMKVVISIEIPTNISEEGKNKIKELEKILNKE